MKKVRKSAIVLRFLVMISPDKSYFKWSNVCLSRTGFFLMCHQFGILGIQHEHDCIEVRRGGAFSSVLFLRLLVRAVILDCHMRLGNVWDNCQILK